MIAQRTDEDIWYSALAGLDLQIILNSVSIFGFIEPENEHSILATYP